MTNDKTKVGTTLAEGGAVPDADASPSPWHDPRIPVGDSPPMPRWPLPVFGIAWAGWIAFLFWMASSP